MNLWKRLTRTLERADLPLRTVEFLYVVRRRGLRARRSSLAVARARRRS